MTVRLLPDAFPDPVEMAVAALMSAGQSRQEAMEALGFVLPPPLIRMRDWLDDKTQKKPDPAEAEPGS